MATQSTRFLPGHCSNFPEMENRDEVVIQMTPRPSSLVRQTTVLLQNGDIVKAKISFPSQNQMDLHTLYEMMKRWRERSAFIEAALATQKLSRDDVFTLQSEWTMLVRRMNAGQTLVDLLKPMEV